MVTGMVTIMLCKYRYKKSSYCLVTAFFCGATRTLFSLIYLITKIKRNKKCVEI